MTVRTGPLASGGKQMDDALRLFLKERNSTIAGRKVELISIDTAGTPAIAKSKAQELVEKHKVHAIIGPLAAFEALALDDYIRKSETPIISPSAAADDMTQRKPNPWFVRAVASSSQQSHPLGEYAAKTLNYRRVAIIGDDLAYGHEVAAGFQRTFEDNGGMVVQKLWPPLNAPDYGNYIGQLTQNVDAVYAVFAGANGVKFMKQYNEYGLKGKIPVLGAMTTVDEGNFKSTGDEALGVISSGWYAASLNNPANRAYADGMLRTYQQEPGYYATGAYGAALMLEAAMVAVKGRVEDKAAFMQALRNVQVTTDPRGKVNLDALGNPVLDIHIRRLEKRDGKLVNTVIKTYPAVSQFWTYKTAEFLANPVYSRDFPVAKNLGK
ncbi:ABC transporter substrate-binding protein (plasmid) [Variovorax paradoxus]|nr:ABC transporter substrate-binding protein [Variovorax paradoxus]